MARYIDADDFYKRLSDPPYTIYNGEMFAEWFDECFKTQPTADVQPVKRGKWERKEICTNCKTNLEDLFEGEFYYDCEELRFCPRCGAKMDGDNNVKNNSG